MSNVNRTFIGWNFSANFLFTFTWRNCDNLFRSEFIYWLDYSIYQRWHSYSELQRHHNDADLLYLYPAQIGRLIITLSSDVDFTSLINLRSLTIKYGTFIQFDRIRPQYFHMLEILHIFGGKLRKSLMKVLTVDLIVNSELMLNYYFRSLWVISFNINFPQEQTKIF